MQMLRRTFSSSAAFLCVTMAYARPQPDDYLGTESGSLPTEFSWWAFALYAGGIVATALLPNRFWLIKALAWFWPILFWLVVMYGKS